MVSLGNINMPWKASSVIAEDKVFGLTSPALKIIVTKILRDVSYENQRERVTQDCSESTAEYHSSPSLDTKL